MPKQPSHSDGHAAHGPSFDDPMQGSIVHRPGNDNTPVGLDLNSFLVPSENDLDVINEIMESHPTIMGVTSRRLSSIKVILNWWTKGNISSAINALSMMQDLSVIMDVINHTFADNQKIQCLNYDNISQILPHCSSLINSKYETHITTGLKAVQNILHFYQGQIKELKTTNVL